MSKLKRLPKIIFILFFAGAGLFALADRFSHLELFAQTLNLIKTNYFQPVKMEKLVYGAIKGLIREIDPHSHFFLPKDFENLKDETSGKFYGLGLEVDIKDGHMTVISVIQNSPAEKAGIQHGDQILKINDRKAEDFTIIEFRHFFKQRGKTHKVTLLRKDQKEPLTFRVRAGHIKIKSVYVKQMKEDLFYLRIYYFSENTLLEINRFLKNKKIKGMVLDLRRNPGGVFEQSVKVADLFLNEGLIVQYKLSLDNDSKKFTARHSDSLPDFPLVVLIDKYSASGSEIVAGALKDHKRATLVGQKSFGKGSIQNIFSLAKGHALKLTVGEYQTPSGKFIHKKGISPHIKIKKTKLTKKEQMKLLKSPTEDPEVLYAFRILKKKL